MKNNTNVYGHFASSYIYTTYFICLAIKRLHNYFILNYFFFLNNTWGFLRKKVLTSKSMKTSSSRLEHPSLAMMSKVASMFAWLIDNVSSMSLFRYFLFRLMIDSLWQKKKKGLFMTHWCTIALLLNFWSTGTEEDTADSYFCKGKQCRLLALEALIYSPAWFWSGQHRLLVCW